MAQLRRYELTDAEWKIIDPLLPRKSRGVARVDDRRVLNGIFWRLRSGSPWADVPERYGPHTTCYNRFVRWQKAGIWDKLLEAVSQAYNGKIQMIDSSVVRVHQHAANGEKKAAAKRLCANIPWTIADPRLFTLARLMTGWMSLD
jgi:transposase